MPSRSRLLLWSLRAAVRRRLLPTKVEKGTVEAARDALAAAIDALAALRDDPEWEGTEVERFATDATRDLAAMSDALDREWFDVEFERYRMWQERTAGF